MVPNSLLLTLCEIQMRIFVGSTVKPNVEMKDASQNSGIQSEEKKLKDLSETAQGVFKHCGLDLNSGVNQKISIQSKDALTPLQWVIKKYRKWLNYLRSPLTEIQMEARQHYISAIDELLKHVDVNTLRLDPEISFQSDSIDPDEFFALAIPLQIMSIETDLFPDETPLVRILARHPVDLNTPFKDAGGCEKVITYLAKKLGHGVDDACYDPSTAIFLLTQPNIDVRRDTQVNLIIHPVICEHVGLTNLLLDLGAPVNNDSGILLSSFELFERWLDESIPETVIACFQSLFDTDQKLNLTTVVNDTETNEWVTPLVRCFTFANNSSDETCFQMVLNEILWQALQIGIDKGIAAVEAFLVQVLGPANVPIVQAVLVGEFLPVIKNFLTKRNTIKTIAELPYPPAIKQLEEAGFDSKDSLNQVKLIDDDLFTPLMYAVVAGEKLLAQFLWNCAVVREEAERSSHIIECAIHYKSRAILAMLLSQTQQNLKKLFVFALHTEDYSRPTDRFGVIRIFLDNPKLNKELSDRELAHYLIEFLQERELDDITTHVLFRALKQRMPRIFNDFQSRCSGKDEKSSTVSKQNFLHFLAKEVFGKSLENLPTLYKEYLWQATVEEAPIALSVLDPEEEKEARNQNAFDAINDMRKNIVDEFKHHKLEDLQKELGKLLDFIPPLPRTISLITFKHELQELTDGIAKNKVSLYYERAKLWLQKGCYREALIDSTLAIGLVKDKDKSRLIYEIRLRALECFKAWQLILHDTAMLTANNPQNHFAHFMQAMAYFELNQDDKATESCLAALSNPNFAAAGNSLLDRIANKKRGQGSADVKVSDQPTRTANKRKTASDSQAPEEEPIKKQKNGDDKKDEKDDKDDAKISSAQSNGKKRKNEEEQDEDQHKSRKYNSFLQNYNSFFRSSVHAKVNTYISELENAVANGMKIDDIRIKIACDETLTEDERKVILEYSKTLESHTAKPG